MKTVAAANSRKG